MMRTLRRFIRAASGKKTTLSEAPKEPGHDKPYEKFDFYELKKQEMKSNLKKNRTLFSFTDNTIRVSEHFYKNVDVKIVGSIPDVYDSGQAFVEYVEETRPSTFIIGMANPETLQATKGIVSRNGIVQKRADSSL